MAALAVSVGMTSCDKVVEPVIDYVTNLFVPKFDADKPEESVKAMTKEMDDVQKSKLVAAMAALALAKGVEGSRTAMDGKTAEQIIEMAKECAGTLINQLF